LNRNFGVSEETFHTPNPDYETIAPLFASHEPLKAPLVPIVSTAALVMKARRLGLPPKKLSQAIGQGQFKDPKGLEYGGETYEPQVRFFIDRFRPIAKGYERILHFDLHTGLGEKNRLHLLTGATEESRNERLLKLLVHGEEDRAFYEFTEMTEPGFYRTVGDINTLMPVLTPGAEVLSLTLEFATLGNGLTAKLDTLERLRLENQGFISGYANEASELIVKRKFAELFAPTDSKWRENTVATGRETLTRFLERSGSLPS
jgi:hypothetical protein